MSSSSETMCIFLFFFFFFQAEDGIRDYKVTGVQTCALPIFANGCTVLDGARIGARTMIAAHSLVAANAEIPDEVLAAGSPAVVKRPIAGTPAEFWVQTNPSAYADLAQRHRAGVRPVPAP